MPASDGRPSSTPGPLQTGYRGFEFGDTVAAVAARANAAPSSATVRYQRPALIQDLSCRACSSPGAPDTDPVHHITFSFYDDQLFRVAVEYDRARTEGLTDADVIDAVSSIYGPALKAAGPQSIGGPQNVVAARPSGESDADTLIASWRGDHQTGWLYRSADGVGLHLLVESRRLAALVRAATAQALRLEDRDALQRERARQKEAADVQAAQDRARLINRATFVP